MGCGEVFHKDLTGADLHEPKSGAFVGTFVALANVITYETPSPVADGTVVTFQVANIFEPGTLQVFMDGVRQVPTDEFTEEAVASPTGFTTTFTLDTGEILSVAYFIKA